MKKIPAASLSPTRKGLNRIGWVGKTTVPQSASFAYQAAGLLIFQISVAVQTCFKLFNKLRTKIVIQIAFFDLFAEVR